MTSNKGERILKVFIARVRKVISPQDYDKWIARLGILLRHGESGKTIVLVSHNRIVDRWVRQQFFPLLQKIAQEISQDDEHITVDLSLADGKVEKVADVKSKSTYNYADNYTLRPQQTFDSFIQGDANRFAYTSALEVAEGAKKTGPLILYSPSGQGKTHLARAIAYQSLYQSKKRVAFVHSEKFFRERFLSIKNKNDDFRFFYSNLDVFIVDDIHFLSGKDGTQEEFLHIYNILHDQGKQMVFTCDRHPKFIGGLHERIKTRLGYGISVAIKPPDTDLRINLLRHLAQSSGQNFPEESLLFIAERIKSNVRELQGTIRNISARAESDGSEISLSMVKETLLDVLSVDRNITGEIIQKTVANYYKIRVSDLMSTSKSRSIVRPRQVAMTLMKNLTTKSLPEIGRDFGGKDHSTVIYAIKKVGELSRQDQHFQNEYKNIERSLLT